MREVCPAWPPGPALDEHGAQALGRPVDRRAQPGRSAADHDEVVEVGGRRGGQADGRGDLGRRGRPSTVPSGVTRTGTRPRWRPRLRAAARRRALDVVPAVRHGVAGQEVTGGERLAPTSGARAPCLLDLPVADGAPGLDQGIDHRVSFSSGGSHGLSR